MMLQKFLISTFAMIAIFSCDVRFNRIQYFFSRIEHKYEKWSTPIIFAGWTVYSWILSCFKLSWAYEDSTNMLHMRMWMILYHRRITWKSFRLKYLSYLNKKNQRSTEPLMDFRKYKKNRWTSNKNQLSTGKYVFL